MLHSSSNLKRQIIDAKPIGARIDSTRGALERARKRQDTAATSARLAQTAVETATLEVSKLEAELLELEAAVAADHSRPPKALSLEQFQADMTTVLHKMVTSGNVTEGDMSECRVPNVRWAYYSRAF